MPFVQFSSKERVEKQFLLIQELSQNCSACSLLKEKTADQVFIYTVHDCHFKDPAMLAFAQFDSCHAYAVHAPEDMPEEHFSIFSHFLANVNSHREPEEKIVVFSQRIYDALMKRNTYKQFPVELHSLG